MQRIRYALEVIVELVHILARQEERQDHKRAEYEVNFFINISERQWREIWQPGASAKRSGARRPW